MNTKLLIAELKFLSEMPVVSIWWITRTAARANRIAYLEKCGAIVRDRSDPRDQYPYCVFETRHITDGHGSACLIICEQCGKPTGRVFGQTEVIIIGMIAAPVTFQPPPVYQHRHTWAALVKETPSVEKSNGV